MFQPVLKYKKSKIILMKSLHYFPQLLPPTESQAPYNVEPRRDKQFGKKSAKFGYHPGSYSIPKLAFLNKNATSRSFVFILMKEKLYGLYNIYY